MPGRAPKGGMCVLYTWKPFEPYSNSATTQEQLGGSKVGSTVRDISHPHNLGSGGRGNGAGWGTLAVLIRFISPFSAKNLRFSLSSNKTPGTTPNRTIRYPTNGPPPHLD